MSSFVHLLLGAAIAHVLLDVGQGAIASSRMRHWFMKAGRYGTGRNLYRVYHHVLYHVYAQVFSIRAAATDNLAKLAQEFGADWAQEHLVPQVGILDVHGRISFLHDFFCLGDISSLA